MLDARAGNPSVRELWDADRDSFVEPVAAMIEAERAAGRAPEGPDAGALATVLLELNDRALERLSHRRRAAARGPHRGAGRRSGCAPIYGTTDPTGSPA